MAPGSALCPVPACPGRDPSCSHMMPTCPLAPVPVPSPGPRRSFQVEANVGSDRATGPWGPCGAVVLVAHAAPGWKHPAWCCWELFAGASSCGTAGDVTTPGSLCHFPFPVARVWGSAHPAQSHPLSQGRERGP